MNEHAYKIWRAWLDGNTVQIKCGFTKEWKDFDPSHAFIDFQPQVRPGNWRIKPQVRSFCFRAFFDKEDQKPRLIFGVDSNMDHRIFHECETEESCYFGGWLTDWVEYQKEEELNPDPESPKDQPDKPTSGKPLCRRVEDPNMIRLGRIFWSLTPDLWPVDDIQRFDDVSPTDREIENVCRYYSSRIRDESELRSKRDSMGLLLDNWSSEVGKAKKFIQKWEAHIHPISYRENNDSYLF